MGRSSSLRFCQNSNYAVRKGGGAEDKNIAWPARYRDALVNAEIPASVSPAERKSKNAI
jgi:hypothetical protein